MDRNERQAKWAVRDQIARAVNNNWITNLDRFKRNHNLKGYYHFYPLVPIVLLALDLENQNEHSLTVTPQNNLVETILSIFDTNKTRNPKAHFKLGIPCHLLIISPNHGRLVYFEMEDHLYNLTIKLA